MFYVALSNVNQNIERVAMRVKNGGHDIPTEDIIRRSKTSFEHLYNNVKMIDNLVLIDNSEDDGEIVLEVNDSQITFESSNLPLWAYPVREQFKV